MIIKFIKYRDPNKQFDLSNLEYSFEADTLNEIVDEFKCFLKSCGFYESQIKQVFNEEDEE